MKITPLKKPVIATVRMPGSKSYTNRALVMAALTKGSVSLINPLYSDDTQAMIGCLRALGVEIERTACRNPTPSGVGLGKLFDGAVSGDSRTASKSYERISSSQGGVLQKASHSTECRDRYLQFLSSGGSRYPLDLLQIAGVDLRKKEPIELAMKRFRGLVKELKTLLGE